MRHFAIGVLVFAFVSGCGSDDSSKSSPEAGGGTSDAGDDAASGDGSTGTDGSADATHDVQGDVEGDAEADAAADAAEDATTSANPLEYWKAGTRLAPVFTVTTSEDGASITQFDTWHDTQLDMDCRFGITGGNVPCGPTNAFTISESTTYYSDSSCTTPALRVWVGAGEPPPEYVTRKVNCSAVYYTTGTTLPQVYWGSGTTCQVASTQSGYYFYTENALTEMTGLATVTATKHNVFTEEADGYTPGSRLVADVVLMSGDDGSEARIWNTFMDGQLNRVCSVETIVQDNSSRCLPDLAVAYEDEYYLDAACTELAAYIWDDYEYPTDSCETSDPLEKPDIARQSYDGDGCYVGVSTFAWPQGVTGSPSAYPYYNNQCGSSPYTPGNSYRYFAVDDLFGSPQDPSTYAHLDWTLDEAPAPNTSGTRIVAKSRHYSAGDGLTLQTSYASFVDNDLGVRCYPSNTSDGKVRCLPEGGYGRIAFSDDACTQAVFAFSKPTACTGYEYVLVGDSDDAVDVYAMPEGPYTDAGVLYRLDGATCAGSNYGSSYAILTTFPDKLPLSNFAEMTQTSVQK